MTRLAIFGISAAALIAGLLYGAHWLREDAQADLIRQQMIEQAKRDARSVSDRDARIKEIENADDDALRARACAGGMLPAASCP